jgi:hypothetical protein
MAISRRLAASAIFLTVLPVGPAGVAGAQSVLLQIRPPVGDTLSVRMDQRVEMTGVPTGCVTGYSGNRRGASPDTRAETCTAATRQMTTVTEVFSRAIVQSASGEGAHVLAVTDSIRTSLSSGNSRAVKPTRVRTNTGSIELRVATDGGAKVVDAAASEQMRAVFGQMPATLSRKPVAVGERWTRQMRLPIATETGSIGMVRATFRLDSLGRNGDIAYISMKGTLSHDHGDGSDSDMEGWMSGTMQLDRRLAWITDTRATIDVESTVRPSSGGQRMRVRTKITQVLRARSAK